MDITQYEKEMLTIIRCLSERSLKRMKVIVKWLLEIDKRNKDQ